MAEQIETSIYNDVKQDIEQLLKTKHCNKKELELYNEISGKKDIVILYLVDETAIKEFKVFKTRLQMEYSYTKKFNQELSLESIVKLINIDIPSHYWKIHPKATWTQINDQDKVRAKIEGEFIKWKNTILKNTKKKQKEKKNSQQAILDVEQKIHQEISVAQKELEHILENFDQYDVRISGYKRRTFALMLNYKISDDKSTYLQVALNKTKPNILWFKELSEEEKIRTNNKLIHYLQKAKNPFGDVYFLPKDVTEDEDICDE